MSRKENVTNVVEAQTIIQLLENCVDVATRVEAGEEVSSKETYLAWRGFSAARKNNSTYFRDLHARAKAAEETKVSEESAAEKIQQEILSALEAS